MPEANPSGAPAISVALCTYNGAAYLAIQLDSILAQTHPPQELVAFDDASPDGTWAILQAYEARFRAAGIAIALRRNAMNLGFVANFEQALQATTGDIVFLCDQDDIWHPDKIARFLPEFERRPDLMVLHSDARLVDGHGNDLRCSLFEALEVGRDEIDAIHAGHAFEVLVRRNLVTGATMAVRRRVLDSGLAVPDGWIHDEWLAIIATFVGTVDCLECPTIDYRQHGGNQMGARRRGFVERVTGSGASRLDFMTRTLRRTQTLLDLAQASPLPLDATALAMLRDRLAHARFRAAPPERWPARLTAVLREYASGRYSRFSNGPRSALSDLLLLRR